jgi:RNA polymerase sigma-70 factor (ECF subfamily)
VRRFIHNDDEAVEVTQGFFASFLERGALAYADRSRGKFRTFLIACVRRYMQEQHRGASVKPAKLPIEDIDAAITRRSLFERATDDPADLFMKNWVKCLLETTLARLKRECDALGKRLQYDVFARRLLSDRAESYASIAQALSLSEKQVGNFFERAKKRFARILRDEVRDSMWQEEDPDEEIRRMLAILAA